jgi:phosphate transport system permease protein
VVRGILLAAALSSIVISAFIVYTVVVEAAKFVTTIDLGDLVRSADSTPRPVRYQHAAPGYADGHGDRDGCRDPVGLGSAIYLAITPHRGRRTVKPILEILAGIPSVVLGFFAWR